MKGLVLTVRTWFHLFGKNDRHANRINYRFEADQEHCWLLFRSVSTSTPQDCFFYTVCQPFCPKPVVVPDVVVAKVQDPPLGPVELHPPGLSPAIQLAQNPL